MRSRACLLQHHCMLRLVLVEDSRDIRPRMLRCLSEIDSVSLLATAESIEEAEKTIQDLKPDLLLLDLSLPEGHALAHIRRFIALAPDMEVVIHSNDARASTRQKCLDAGAHAFFDKSGELEDLLTFVQERALFAR